MSEAILYADGARGVYIPQYFAENINRKAITGIEPEALDILAENPDQEWYWETWNEVLDNAVVTDNITGIVYRLYQDGDLWLIPDDMVWDDESQFFVKRKTRGLDRNLQCPDCGRDYAGDETLKPGDDCPSDDCLSHDPA